jgi:hypothetical protein
MQPMLNHPDCDRRQLSNLVPPRLHRVNQLRLGEDVRASAAPLRPKLDRLVHLIGRKQPSIAALMTGLATLLAARPLPARPPRR